MVNTGQDLRYPIGNFNIPAQIRNWQLDEWTKQLEEFPGRLHILVDQLTDEQLDTPYRPAGWTVRQVVHHLADSHHNSYIRFKWALTEENPLIKIYDEKGWAALHDSRSAPIKASLDHLAIVHAKLVYLIKGLSPEQLKRTFRHPEIEDPTSLEENIGRYAWHGEHHYAHIHGLLVREGWI